MYISEMVIDLKCMFYLDIFKINFLFMCFVVGFNEFVWISIVSIVYWSVVIIIV